MFDWDDVPEQLGGPNQAALDLEAEVERENRKPDVGSLVERAERRKAERAGQKSADAKPVAKKKPKAAAASPADQLLAASRAGSLMSVMRLLQMGANPNGESGGAAPIAAAAAAGSLDACAALLLHGARASDADVGAVPKEASVLRTLLELFGGRAPKPGELPQVVNALDPLIRPQVAQTIMSMVAAQGPPAPGPPAPAPSACRPMAAASQAERSQARAPPAREAEAPRPAQQPPKPAVQSAARPKPTQPTPARPSVRAAPAPEERPPAQRAQPSQPAQPVQPAQPARPVAAAAPADAAAETTELSLLCAVQLGDLPQVTKLLNSRAEPNEYDRLGETPLFAAASQGQPDVVATLLICNAEPLTRSIHGKTCWDVASGRATRSLLSFFAGQELEDPDQDHLLQCLDATREAVRHEIAERAANRRGLRPAADPSDPSAEGRRQRPLPPLPPAVKAARDALAAQDLNQDPLACAAREGKADAVLKLLEGGRNPNIGDELGETPLFEAASAGSVDVVAALLVHRADPNLKSLSGGRAADLATDPVTKSLLATYAGGAVSEEERIAACRAISDDELRDEVANRFRAELFRASVLPRYMQKLRA